MKEAIWGLGGAFVGVFFFVMGWIGHAEFGRATFARSSADMVSMAGTTPGNPNPAAAYPHPPNLPNSPLVSPTEWQHLRDAREAALQANPNLAAEFKQITEDMQTQQSKIEAAMVKVDPKLASVIAKLDALRQHNGTHVITSVPVTK